MRWKTWLGAIAVLAAGPATAWAAPSCAGTWSASLLRQLPQPLVVGLDVRDDSRRNLELAARFNDGLRHAGAAVSGAPTAHLRMVFSVGGELDSASPTRPGDAFGWMGGGVRREVPGQSRFGDRDRNFTQTPIQVRAELRSTPNGPVDWVATLQCTRLTDDDGQLAYDIGAVIGGGLGRRVDRARF